MAIPVNPQFNEVAEQGYNAYAPLHLAQAELSTPAAAITDRAARVADAYIEQVYNPKAQQYLDGLSNEERAAAESAVADRRDALHDAIEKYESVEVTTDEVVAAREALIADAVEREVAQIEAYVSDRAGFDTVDEWREAGSPVPNDLPGYAAQYFNDNGEIDLEQIQNEKAQTVMPDYNIEAGIRQERYFQQFPEERLTQEEAFEMAPRMLTPALQERHADLQFDEDGNALTDDPELLNALTHIQDNVTRTHYLTDTPGAWEMGLGQYMMDRTRLIQDLEHEPMQPPIRQGSLDTDADADNVVQVAALDDTGITGAIMPATATPDIAGIDPAADAPAADAPAADAPAADAAATEANAMSGIGSILMAMLQMGNEYMSGHENPLVAQVWSVVCDYLGIEPAQPQASPQASPQALSEQLLAEQGGEPVTLTDAALAANDHHPLSAEQQAMVREIADALQIDPNHRLDIANNPVDMNIALTMGAAVQSGGINNISAETQSAIDSVSGYSPQQETAPASETDPRQNMDYAP